MIKNWYLWSAICSVFALVAWMADFFPSKKGAAENFDRLPVELLMQNIRFSLGESKLELPLLVLDQVYVTAESGYALHSCGEKPRQRQVRALLATQPEPLAVVGLSIHTDLHSHCEADEKALRLCEKLSQQWARHMCLGQVGGLLHELPRQFTLLQRKQLALLDSHYLGESLVPISKLVAHMNFDSGQPQMICGKEVRLDSRMCVAGQSMDQHLVAIWTMGRRTGKSTSDLDLQGQAIRSFLGIVQKP